MSMTSPVAWMIVPNSMTPPRRHASGAQPSPECDVPEYGDGCPVAGRRCSGYTTPGHPSTHGDAPRTRGGASPEALGALVLQVVAEARELSPQGGRHAVAELGEVLVGQVALGEPRVAVHLEELTERVIRDLEAVEVERVGCREQADRRLDRVG